MDIVGVANKKQKRVQFPASRAFSISLLLTSALLFLWQSSASAAPGGVLPSFGTNGTYVLPFGGLDGSHPDFNQVAVQRDGSILLAGSHLTSPTIVRLTSTGALDTTYGTGGVVHLPAPSGISAIMLQPDGKLLVGVSWSSGNYLTRLTSSGVVDPTFGASGTVATLMHPEVLAIAPDGKILVGGQTVLSRFQPNGAIDTSLGTSGSIQLPAGVWPLGLAVDADLSIVAGGESIFPGVPRRQRVARILANGSLDGQFGTQGIADATLPTAFGNVTTASVSLDSARRILVGGMSTVGCGAETCYTIIVHRFTPTGALDSTFGSAGLFSLGGNNAVFGGDLAVQPDGAILVTTYGNVGNAVGVVNPTWSEIVVLRLLPSGTLDPSFGVGGIVRRDLAATEGCILIDTRSIPGIRPDGVAFVIGRWESTNDGCGDKYVAVSSVLLRDANDDGQPEAWDLTPDPFVFANVVNAPPNVTTVSGLATVQGLDAGVAVPVSVNGGELALNGSTTYRSTAWIANGDQVNVRQQSSATLGASVTMQIAAGGVQPANNIPLVLGSQATSTFTTITRSGPPGTLAFAATTASVAETAGSVSLSVTRSGGSAGAISVSYTTAAGTAQSPSDFTATTGILSWSDGDTASKTISVSIVNDGVVEQTESFTISLSNPTGGALLGNATETITINDDDAPIIPGQLSFSSTSLSVAEALGSVTLSVARLGGTSGAVSVSYATANGSASGGSDFTSTSGTLSWANGDAVAKTLTVPIINDSVNEATKTFTVTLSAATGGATISSGIVTISILDDDAAPPPPPAPTPTPAASSGGGALGIDALLALLLIMGWRPLRRRITSAVDTRP